MRTLCRARALLALALVAGLAAAQEPTPAQEPAATEPSAQQPASASEPPEPGAPWTPDRTREPWSQTAYAPIGVGSVERHRLSGAMHWRMGTARGVVHLWRPPRYRWQSAGIVVYVHGYYTNVDQAVEDHRLLEQFEQSGRNALFIAPEAPSWNGEEVSWPDLEALLEESARLAGVKLPKGPVVVVGHSGAFRTVLPWLAHPRVEEVILLDGFYYRMEDALNAWLEAAEPKGRRRVLLVGQETSRRAEAWLNRHYPQALRHRQLPSRPPAARAPERRAPVVYVRTQDGHMEIVTQGRFMPELLGWTRLRGR